jgi:hypothetical protein
MARVFFTRWLSSSISSCCVARAVREAVMSTQLPK